MNVIQREGKSLLGWTIRTCNENEKSKETAKILGLWQTFYKDVYKELPAEEIVYGVYSEYESDHTGYFNVSAAIDTASNIKIEGRLQPIELVKGQYLSFTPTTTGEDRVYKLWEQVWNFFSDETQALKRAYTTDYEIYYPNNDVELFIAIK